MSRRREWPGGTAADGGIPVSIAGFIAAVRQPTFGAHGLW